MCINSDSKLKLKSRTVYWTASVWARNLKSHCSSYHIIQLIRLLPVKWEENLIRKGRNPECRTEKWCFHTWMWTLACTGFRAYQPAVNVYLPSLHSWYFICSVMLFHKKKKSPQPQSSPQSWTYSQMYHSWSQTIHEVNKLQQALQSHIERTRMKATGLTRRENWFSFFIQNSFSTARCKIKPVAIITKSNDAIMCHTHFRPCMCPG